MRETRKGRRWDEESPNFSHLVSKINDHFTIKQTENFKFLISERKKFFSLENLSKEENFIFSNIGENVHRKKNLRHRFIIIDLNNNMKRSIEIDCRLSIDCRLLALLPSTPALLSAARSSTFQGVRLLLPLSIPLSFSPIVSALHTITFALTIYWIPFSAS